MYFLIYVSVAEKPFSSTELLDLLEHARRNNEKAHVTGMLLYKEGNFLQVLEGEERVVKALSAKISRDPRHSKVITMLEGPLVQREFSDWSMGFSNLDAATNRFGSRILRVYEHAADGGLVHQQPDPRAASAKCLQAFVRGRYV